jgi:acetylornithine/succinyldiaminopimelate/putrescine aminotransferase
MAALSSNPILGHLTTFGGHPVSCAAASACISVIQEEKLVESIQSKEDLFRKLLIHPKIKEIRGKGLMLAIQFESSERLFSAIDNCLKSGIVTDWFLFCDDAMRIAPPLTISETEITEACNIIIKCLNQ